VAVDRREYQRRHYLLRREEISRRRAERWKNDPEYREACNRRRRGWRARDPVLHNYAKKVGVGIRTARIMLAEVEARICARRARAGTADSRPSSGISRSASREEQPDARG